MHIICMPRFLWVHIYFPLNLINQVSSTSDFTYLARLLFLVFHFHSSLEKLTTLLLVFWGDLFLGSGFIFMDKKYK